MPDKTLVGFVGFSSQTNTVVEPTLDVARSAERCGASRPTAAPRPATRSGRRSTGWPRDAARTAGARPPRSILLSDGKRTEGGDPLAAARRAAQLGIPVSTVALGTDEGSVPGPAGEPIPVPPDPATLQEISRITGGTFQAADAGDLADVYEKLGSKIGTKRVKREVSSSFAAAGLALMLAGLGTGLRWRGAAAVASS